MFATAALSSQSAPANYDKMRLLGLHIACQYGVHINREVSLHVFNDVYV